MSTAPETPTALADLLAAFDVTSVVAVDDGDRDLTFNSELQATQIENGDTPVDELMSAEGVSQLLDDRGIDPEDELAARELIADAVRNGEVSFGTPAAEAGTASAFAILSEVLAEAGLDFNVVHFDDWTGPESVEPTTLVLFDFRHGNTPQGVDLAVAYIAFHGPEARVAILSQEPGEAHELWRDHIAGVDDAVAQRLVWIPKASLTTEASTIVEQLAVALSAPLLRQIQVEGVQLLHEALEETAEAAAALDPYELHHLTTAAAGDGTFEPESLITRFARRSLPVAVARMQLRAPVHKAIRRLRHVDDSNVLTPSSTGRLIELQRDDYYLSRSHLVGRHQAAAAGDIFALVSPELVAKVLSDPFEPGTDPLLADLQLDELELCVLVGQPCDLAVRKEGDRALTGRWLEALPISVPGGDSDKTKMGAAVHNKQPVFRLPWLVGAVETGHRRVTYKHVLSLPMLAVDVCVWSGADAAAVSIDDDPSPSLSPNWQTRHEATKEELDQIFKACVLAASLGDDDQAMAERITLDAAASDSRLGFHYSPDERTMAWGLVRVARLRPPYVESLLTSYNDYRRRDAFPAALA